MDAREAELSEHLEELRARLIRCTIYVGLSTVAAWLLYGWIYRFLTAPVSQALQAFHTKFLLTHLAEGFMIRLQVSLIAGLILAVPFVTFELWRFVAPGLTKSERRAARWVAPLSVVLFALGVVIGYTIFPTAVKWFVSYVPARDAELRPSLAGTIIFIAKMLLAFGLVFELPIVLLFLAKLGIVNSRMLKSQWRYGIVGIAILAAVATPSTDAISMLAMAVPLAVLYAVSIALIRIVEPR